MLKTILVPLSGFDSDKVALETAHLLAGPFGGHIEALRVHPGPAQIVARATVDLFEMLPPEILEAFQEEDKARTLAARQIFGNFCKAFAVDRTEVAGLNRVTANWRECVGDEARETIARGRYHDVIVSARPHESALLSSDGIGSVLMEVGRPVVLAPAQTPERMGRKIAVAWKETAESARAVTVAMPLLAKADAIVVLVASEDQTCEGCNETTAGAEMLCKQLSRHGFVTELRLVIPSGRSLADAVVETACDMKADMLVMGAYGHSRVRELVFGGFTRDVIASCRLPVMLFH